MRNAGNSCGCGWQKINIRAHPYGFQPCCVSQSGYLSHVRSCVATDAQEPPPPALHRFQPTGRAVSGFASLRYFVGQFFPPRTTPVHPLRKNGSTRTAAAPNLHRQKRVLSRQPRSNPPANRASGAVRAKICSTQNLHTANAPCTHARPTPLSSVCYAAAKMLNTAQADNPQSPQTHSCRAGRGSHRLNTRVPAAAHTNPQQP